VREERRANYRRNRGRPGVSISTDSVIDVAANFRSMPSLLTNTTPLEKALNRNGSAWEISRAVPEQLSGGATTARWRSAELWRHAAPHSGDERREPR